MIELTPGSALDSWKLFIDLVDLNFEDLYPFQLLPFDLTPAISISWRNNISVSGKADSLC